MEVMEVKEVEGEEDGGMKGEGGVEGDGGEGGCASYPPLLIKT